VFPGETREQMRQVEQSLAVPRAAGTKLR
jgi:hypothetical protein